MNTDAEGRIAAQLAKAMAMICVRNSRLEDLHAGQVSVSKTGDWSDVVVVDAEGNCILWRKSCKQTVAQIGKGRGVAQAAIGQR